MIAVYSTGQAFRALTGAGKEFAGNNEGYRGGTWLGESGDAESG